jgi:hypothetical protein
MWRPRDDVDRDLHRETGPHADASASREERSQRMRELVRKALEEGEGKRRSTSS